MRPETTVIIPTLERPAELRRALGALAASNASDDSFEVVVVDDGGSVDLKPVVDEFETLLDVTLLRQENRGPGAARNLGVREARGALLAFTDDDCLPEPGWIPAMQAAHALDPEALIGGRTTNALTDNRWATTSQVIVEMARLFYTDEQLGPRFFASNNLALPAVGYRELGGFCETFRKAAEDREFCDRWCQAGYHMRYEPEAHVAHAHDLSAVSFWRQHYRYGFGAWEFHRLRRRRRSGQLRDDVLFHFKLGSLLRRATPGVESRARRRLVPLLLVWQVANAFGFFGGLLSAIGSGGGRRRAP